VLATLQLLVSESGSEKMSLQSPTKNIQTFADVTVTMHSYSSERRSKTYNRQDS